MNTSTTIPTLDIRRFSESTDSGDRDAFVRDLGAAYREWGFAGIRGHGIAQSLIDDAYDVFAQFFALPEETKRKYHVAGGGGARGYTPFGVETAKGAQYSDLKEFWHIGREIPRDSMYAGDMPPNLWPAEVPRFREVGYGLYTALVTLGSRVLSALALHIGLPETWFIDKTDSGNSILRPIHYPPITPPDVPNVRAGAHEDINLITLLVGASAEGLEVKSRKGEWKAVDVPEGALVINVGDMLERLTNGRLPSTKHRVVNPRGEAARRSRYSMPFFLHFRPDFLIEPLESCVVAGDSPPPPITAHDFLQQRLREIGLA